MAHRRVELIIFFMVSLTILNLSELKTIKLPKEILEIIQRQTKIKDKQTDSKVNQKVVQNKPVILYHKTIPIYTHKYQNSDKNNKQVRSNAYENYAQSIDSYMKAYKESHKKQNFNLEMEEIKQKNSVFNQLEAVHHTASSNAPFNFKRETEILKITKDDSINTNSRDGDIRDVYKERAKLSIPYRWPHKSNEIGEITIKPYGLIGVGMNQVAQDQQKNNQHLYTSAQESRPNIEQPYIQQFNPGETAFGSYFAQVAAPIQSLMQSSAQASQEYTPNFVGVHSEFSKPPDNKFYTQAIPSDTPSYLGTQTHFEPIEIPKYNFPYAVYEPEKEVKPIIEQENEIENPVTNVQASVVALQNHHTQDNVPATVNNNYYKIEVASQTIENPNFDSNAAQTEPLENQHHAYQNIHDTVKHLEHEESGQSPYTEAHGVYASSYEFGYRVRDPQSGNEFGHHEAKDGDETQGHYHVLLPDGRLQNVKYWAGPSGYQAQISYDGGTEQPQM